MEKLLTADDVATALQCSKAQVFALAGRGEIPSVKIGRLRRFREADVEAYIGGRSTAPSPAA